MTHRMYTIYHSREKVTSIMEVEIEMISGMEDPSVMWLPKGEYKARVLAPGSLYDRDEDGFRTPPLWYSHAFYSTMQEARTYAERQVRQGFERGLQKQGIQYTEEEVQQKLSEIQEVKLS